MTRPSVQTSQIYKTFVGLAVLGLQREADMVMHQFRRQVERTAHYLRETTGFIPKTIYRGLLLRPRDVLDDSIMGRFETQEYISFSEDPEVACWFARKESMITPDILGQDPSRSGWIIEYLPDKKEVLFHYSWAERDGNIGSLPGKDVYSLLLELPIPNIQEQVAQYYWNLKSQKEVSILPPNKQLPLVGVDKFGCPEARILDKKFFFRPDWIMMPIEVASAFGLQPGKKPIIDIDYYRPPKKCPQCNQPGINYMYYLENNVITMPCVVCQRAAWGTTS